MKARDWTVNHGVISYTPPGACLPKHKHPAEYRDGVIVVGIGKAAVYSDDSLVMTDHFSIVHIPPGLPHSIQNVDAPRFSVELMHDATLSPDTSLAVQHLSTFASRLLQQF